MGSAPLQSYSLLSLILGLSSLVFTVCLSIIGRKRREEVYVAVRGVDVIAQTLIHAMIAYMNSLDCTSLMSDPYVPYVLGLRWVVFGISQNQWREWGRWVGKPVFKALKRSKENEGLTALVLVLSVMVCYHKDVLTTKRSVSIIAVAVAMVWPVLQVIVVNSKKSGARIHCSLDAQNREVVTIFLHHCLFVKVVGDLFFLVLGGLYIILLVRSMLGSTLQRTTDSLCAALGLSVWLISTYALWWKQMRTLIRIACRSATRKSLCETVCVSLLHSPVLLFFRSAVLAEYGARLRNPSLPTVPKINEALALVSAFNKNAESRALQDMARALGFDSLSANLRVNLRDVSILLAGCPLWNGLLRRTKLRTTEILRVLERSIVQLCGGVGDDALAVSIINKANVELHARNALVGVEDGSDHMEAAEAISLGSTFVKRLLTGKQD